MVGLGVGLILTRLTRIGAAVIAALAGFLAGLLLNSSVLYLIGSQIAFWTFCGVLGVGAVVCGVFLFNISFILSTSLVGAYFSVRGLSLIAGGFPNEFSLVQNAERGLFEHQAWPYYVYLAAVLVLMPSFACV